MLRAVANGRTLALVKLALDLVAAPAVRCLVVGNEKGPAEILAVAMVVRLLAVTGTKDPGLFTSEHWGMRAFSVKVPNGKYLAKLYFAETYEGITGPGQRVFSFNVQGQEFKDFDVWAKAAVPDAPISKRCRWKSRAESFALISQPRSKTRRLRRSN